MTIRWSITVVKMSENKSQNNKKTIANLMNVFEDMESFARNLMSLASRLNILADDISQSINPYLAAGQKAREKSEVVTEFTIPIYEYHDFYKSIEHVDEQLGDVDWTVEEITTTMEKMYRELRGELGEVKKELIELTG